MMRRIWFPYAFIFGVLGAGLISGPVGLTCDDSLEAALQDIVAGKRVDYPEPISPNTEAQITEHEYTQYAGDVLKRTERIPLELHEGPQNDGTYLYLITDDGEMIYSPQVPDLHARTEGEFLVSHRSLYQHLRGSKNEDVQILAAGEFEVLNGQIKEINNRSNTFPAGEEHLSFAKEKLKRQHGLPVESDTDVVDWSQRPESLNNTDKHLADEGYAKTRLIIEQNESLKELYDRMKSLYFQLYQEIPGEGGRVGNNILERLFEKLGEHRMKEYFSVISGIIPHMKTDGPTLIIKEYSEREEIARLETLLDEMKSMVDELKNSKKAPNSPDSPQ